MAGSGAVTELNLSAANTSTIVDRINSMPALKTSAAFFTFLRANLVLTHSTTPSTVSTPNLGPYPSQSLPPLSPSPLSASTPLGPAALEDDDPPPLSLEILTSRADKAAALKLVADSIAQQRQQAAMSLIFHPLPLAGLLAVLAAIYRYAWAHHDHNHHHDPGTAMLLASGAVTSYLLAIRLATSGYLRAAEALSWDFLADNDVVIGTRFGGEVIGALILRLERPGSSNPHISSPLSTTTSTTAYSHSRTSSISSSSSTSTSSSPSTSNHHNHSNHSNRRKPHSRQNSRRGGGKGVIRAWTTKLRYRGRGVGGDMLREAVRLTRERRGRDAQVGFAREHANSVAVLPELFNRGLRQREMRAARALEAVLAAWEGGRRR